MKLRSRINLYTAVLFIGLIVFINIASYYSFSRILLSSELERATLEATRTVKGINDPSSTIPTDDLLLAYVPVNGMLQIVREDGSVDKQAISPDQEKLRDFPTAYQKVERKNIAEFNGDPHAFISIPIIWAGGEVAELQIIENLSPTAESLKTLQIVLIVVTLIAVIPVIISTRLLSNFISKPISSMIITMREIRKSGQFKRIPLTKESKDELYLMGETFNEMMELLQVNYEKQEQFVSNASHELKTPLTVIESYASLLKRRGMKDPAIAEEAVDAIHSEAIRMSELTQQLLLLAKHDEQWKIENKEVSLSKLIEDSVRSFQEAYKRKINLVIEKEMIVNMDEQKLRQLFYIIMDNARKYSEASITVNICSENEKAIIKIIDKGIGIPAKDLEKVFDRFYRVDKARTRKSGGTGLGLSLAKELAEAIGVQIKLESEEGIGTTAQIILQLADSH